MDHLRAGAALFNAGHYLAAHEPWEARWLQAPAGEREDCLQGLVQTTAAVYKAHNGPVSGAVGLAESAPGYLAACERVDTAALVAYLEELAADPELPNRERPPPVVVDGEAVDIDDLTFSAAAIAVDGLAETRGDDAVERAVAYAEADIEAGETTSTLVSLLFEYLREPNPIVRDRIADHVQRRTARESDVDGLFEDG